MPSRKLLGNDFEAIPTHRPKEQGTSHIGSPAPKAGRVPYHQSRPITTSSKSPFPKFGKMEGAQRTYTPASGTELRTQEAEDMKHINDIITPRMQLVPRTEGRSA